MSQRGANSDKLRDFWIKVWQNAARIATSPTSCTAACLFLAKALTSNIVSWERIEAVACNILSSLDLNGPACLSDTSCSLLSVLLSLKISGTSNLGPDVSQRVLRWLFARWKPSMASFKFLSISLK